VEVLSIFLQETPKDLADMQAAAKSKLNSIVANKAHKLKGSAGLLEAKNLKKLLEHIELASKSVNEERELVNLAEAASREYKKIETLLQKHLKTIPQ
jgi:HPt (histidine-containing phosphotransfer) domain-containing protein